MTFTFTPVSATSTIYFSTGVKPTDATGAFFSRVVIDKVSIELCPVPETGGVTAGVALLAATGWMLRRRRTSGR